MDDILLRSDDVGVATLTLNSPANLNALSDAMLAALADAFRALSQDDSIRAIVLRGSGKAFCAGHDLKELRANPEREFYEKTFAACSRLMQAIVARSWFQPQEAEIRARKAAEPLVAVFTRVLQDGLGRGELRQDADLQLLGALVWDVYLSNYRRAAYDEWNAGVLAEQAQRQVELLLSGVRTNA